MFGFSFYKLNNFWPIWYVHNTNKSSFLQVVWRAGNMLFKSVASDKKSVIQLKLTKSLTSYKISKSISYLGWQFNSLFKF